MVKKIRISVKGEGQGLISKGEKVSWRGLSGKRCQTERRVE